jgi:putative transposase
MSRLARMVVPGLPHHVTQRGNRREAIFFEMEISRFIATCLRSSYASSAWRCGPTAFMPNHVHLILTPQGADGMSRALGEAHRRRG